MNATKESRAEMMRRSNADKAKLAAAGWEHIASVMSGDKGNKDYGLLFTRAGERFFYNIETRDSLPA